MKITFRTLHRDLGFFYLGLLIAFSTSGLILNHRGSINPLKYEIETIELKIPEELLVDELTKEIVEKINTQHQISDKVKRFGISDETVWISYESASLEYNKTSGEGVLKRFITTPVIGHMAKLHKNTSNFWIYYSDLFALSILIIAISTMIFTKGKYGFKKYGWKLMLAGLIFPLLFLIFLS